MRRGLKGDSDEYAVRARRTAASSPMRRGLKGAPPPRGGATPPHSSIFPDEEGTESSNRSCMLCIFVSTAASSPMRRGLKVFTTSIAFAAQPIDSSIFPDEEGTERSGAADYLRSALAGQQHLPR